MGTAAPHLPQNLWPEGTPLEQERQTKLRACSMSSSCDRSANSLRAGVFAAGTDPTEGARLAPAGVVECESVCGVCCVCGYGVTRRAPCDVFRGGAGRAGGAVRGAGGGGTAEAECGAYNDSSLLHVGQLGEPMGAHVSHCPQTIPISCCSLPNFVPLGHPVLDGLHKKGQANKAVCRSRLENNSASSDPWLNRWRCLAPSPNEKPTSMDVREALVLVHPASFTDKPKHDPFGAARFLQRTKIP